MSFRGHTVVLMLFLLGSFSCKNQQKASEESEEGRSTKDWFYEVVSDKEFEPPEENGDFEKNDIWVEGDTLYIGITYSGGCEDHNFSLHTTGRYTKTKPPGLKLYFRHQDRDDPCRMVVNRTIKFNIKKLRYEASEAVMLSFYNMKDEVEYAY